MEPQFEVTVGAHNYRADLRINGTKTLLEFDGLNKLDHPHERRRADERERALQRAGWVNIRFAWPELAKLTLIRDRIAEAARSNDITWPIAA